ncbi:MAG: FtsW/RodA/SpoVE family cell cycle protein [Pseudolysinimonas sp.]
MTGSPPIESSARPTFTGTIRIRLRTRTRRRNLELGLLLFAIAIGLASLMLVQLGSLGRIDSGLVGLVIGLSLLVIVVHIALRVVAPEADPFLIPIATLLNLIGIAEITRIDIARGDVGWEAYGVRQVAWSAIAILCALAVLFVVRNHRVLQRYRYVAGFVAIALLGLPFLPLIGLNVNGAQAWIHLGVATFQPGEIAKIALAVFFAGYLVTARDSLSMVGRRFLGITFPRLRDLGPILVVWLLSMAVIVFQQDLGSGLLYFGIFLVMIYVATARAGWVILGLVLFGGGAFVAILTRPYVGARFNGWLNTFDATLFDQRGGSYQLAQGLFGLADGGLAGTGLGRGSPDITPLAESDFIVASLGEELGLIGLFAILVLYLVFVSRGFHIGFAGQDDFGRLLGVGLSFVIALQVFIVVGGVTRVIPLTGLTTPFLAAGGSSLVANWVIVALLVRLSDSVRAQPRLVIEA